MKDLLANEVLLKKESKKGQTKCMKIFLKTFLT